MQYGFYVELDRCLRCYACEVACKNVNQIEPGPRWRRVIEVWGGEFPDVGRTFVSLSCMHCAEPACETACPTRAITKRVEDGIVVVDREKCIGCHYCFFACPFGIPQFGKDGTMQKCNFCLERLGPKEQPACAATCPSKALHAGTMEELAQLAQQKAGKKLVASTEPSMLISGP